MLAADQIVANPTERAMTAEERLVVNAPCQTSNQLLGRLSSDCREDVLARATRVPIGRRQVLLERNVRLRFAYFLESGAASLFAKAGADGANVEIRTLGAGDFVGIPLVLGASVSPHRCIVQVAGYALRIGADDLVDLVEDFPELRSVLLAYVHTALIHSSQLVACNASHSLRERLARWLLIASDRLQSSDIAMTHDVLSRAIAVRRAGITTEMGRMEQAGLIRRHRGSVSVIDRSGLENASCSCYRLLRTSANSSRHKPVSGGLSNVGRISYEAGSSSARRHDAHELAD
jgi:CRP-like cAMP-binding protein